MGLSDIIIIIIILLVRIMEKGALQFKFCDCLDGMYKITVFSPFFLVRTTSILND